MFAQSVTYGQPPSLIKYQPPLDITQKIEAYRQANYLPTQNNSKPSHEDLLNIMLPPREWHQEQQYFMQYVSHSQPERADVEMVKMKLEQSLLKCQARVEGICPVKEKIISQAFDEIIRQVTINAPERGLVLMRLRDQRKMTMAAYQTVYEEGVNYGVKKQAEAEQGVDQIQGQIQALEFKKQRFQKRKEQLQSKKQSIQQKYRQRRVVQTQKMQYEMNALINQNKSLQDFLSNYRHLVEQVIEEPQGEDEPQ